MKERKKQSILFMSTHTTKHLTLLAKSKRSQSALEYMMTYGWAILIIVIVAVILYSMGIFNPSSSVTFTSSGFSPFTVSSSLCNNLGYKIAVIAGPIPNNANSLTISKVYLTSATGANTTTASYTLTNPVTLKSVQSATILIPNVACNAANVHYSISANIQYSYTVSTLGLQTVNTTGTVAGTSIAGKPSVLTSYEPLTITNTQSSATPSPFQQMVNFTSSDSGWTSISTDFGQNVEFFYYNGTVIPSWLESYTSSYAIWWLKIAAIPAGSSETVYVGFAPTTTNLFNNINDGEAPQLSGAGDRNLSSSILYSQFFLLNPWFFASGPYVYNFTFDPDSPIYHSLLAPNLENIEFFYANGTEIPAMAISNINSTSYDASSFKIALYLNSVNLYHVILGFASTSTNLNAISSSFSFTPANNYRREAISTVVLDTGRYGEYDDGQNVFQNYTNFSQYYLDEPGCAFSGASIGFGYGYESACGNAQSAPIFVSSNLQLKIHGGEAVYSYLTPLYPFGSGSTYGYTGGVTLGIEQTFYGGDVGNFSSFYSNGTGMNYLISLNESGKNIITEYKANTSFTNQGYGLYGIGYLGSKVYLYQGNNISSVSSYLFPNSLYPFIGKEGPSVEAKYVFVTNLPPNGVMPSVRFDNVA